MTRQTTSAVTWKRGSDRLSSRRDRWRSTTEGRRSGMGGRRISRREKRIYQVWGSITCPVFGIGIDYVFSIFFLAFLFFVLFCTIVIIKTKYNIPAAFKGKDTQPNHYSETTSHFFLNVFFPFSIVFALACSKHSFSNICRFFSIDVNTLSEIFYGQLLNAIFNVVSLLMFVDSNSFTIPVSLPSPMKSYPSISSLSNPCKYLLFVNPSIVLAEIWAKFISNYCKLDAAIECNNFVSSNSIFRKPPIFKDASCSILLFAIKANKFPSILVHPTSNYLRLEQLPEAK